jgi:hypothetical protein
MKEDASQREHSLRKVFNGPALHRAYGGAVAHDAQRLAAVAYGLSADAALAEGRCVRRKGLYGGHGPRPADVDA